MKNSGKAILATVSALLLFLFGGAAVILRDNGGQGQLLVGIALEEWETGANQANVGQKYYGYWGHQKEAWSCDFIYYCADLCGYVSGTGNTSQYPVLGRATASPSVAWQRLIDAGAEYFSVWEKQPLPGDIVFYYSTPSEAAATDLQAQGAAEICHAGIVVECGEDYSVTVVEGNARAVDPEDPDTSRVVKHTWLDTRGKAWDGMAIYGYIRPDYPIGYTRLVGDLERDYFYQTSSPDFTYHGHPVTDLTESQIANIKNTIYGEYGIRLSGAIAVAQSIRDNVDRGAATYDDFIHACKYYGGYPEREPEEYETETVNLAFDYVFNKGGSAVRHPIYVFYAPDPELDLRTDADFQALFVLKLDFVLEIGPARFFSWDPGGEIYVPPATEPEPTLPKPPPTEPGDGYLDIK